MRFLFLMVSVLFLSSNIAVADYTLRNVYKFENADMVANHDGSNVMNATVTGVSSDSNGNTITIKCLVSLAIAKELIKMETLNTQQCHEIWLAGITKVPLSAQVGQVNMPTCLPHVYTR